ncbi:MAG: hypothetical protein GW939_00805 [Candidatus Magasanikbacteria bacterium]|nr:hypothetical protein [Candidatus Magasanikbacteria bacterium]NCS71940.1 hypothetical protein [Candidatus Magasanikbacteria bacterium]
MTTSQDIIKEIKKEHVTPTPAWKYTMKEVGVWGAWSLGVLCLGAAFAITFFIVSSSDWDVYEVFAPNLVTFTLITIPYVWLFVTGGVAIYLIFTFRQTKRGYRVKTVTIIGSTIALSLVIAGVLQAYDIGEVIDTRLSNQIPQYTRIAHTRDMRWHNPEHGIIAGIVTDIPEPTIFMITDKEGNVWHIIVSSTQYIKAGKKVRIIGSIDEQGNIIAQKALSWQGNKLPAPQFFFMHSENERKNNALRNTIMTGPEQREIIYSQ